MNKPIEVLMETIRELLTDDHRQCDDLFAVVEQAVAAGDWDKADAAFARFCAAMLNHFDIEEATLFPEFEARTGMTMGPTQVMRSEHRQMRELLAAAEVSLGARDADDYSGYAETLLIMAQQHNMKEENILYPMCDQHLNDRMDLLLPTLKKNLDAR